MIQYSKEEYLCMKAILFDFDGVIVDTFSFCYRIMSERYGGITEEEYRAKFEGNINDALKKRQETQPADPSAKPFDFFGQYTPALLACEPNQELVGVVRDLAARYPLVIISSTISSAIDQYLTRVGLREYFQEILGNDVEKSKVKKIQRSLEVYEMKPSETIFVTDTLGDIKEAHMCDVRSIAVTWGFHSEETLLKGKPFKVVHKPAQLLEAINSFETLSVYI